MNQIRNCDSIQFQSLPLMQLKFNNNNYETGQLSSFQLSPEAIYNELDSVFSVLSLIEMLRALQIETEENFFRNSISKNFV